MNYLNYDVFTNLDNVYASMSYFGLMGIIRFVISEYLEKTLIYDFSGPMPVSSNTAGSGSLPVGSNAAGLNYTMQAPNSSGIGSSSADNASTTNDHQKLVEKITKKQDNIGYFEEQLFAANRDLDEVKAEEASARAEGWLDKWQVQLALAKDALKDTENNLKNEHRMYNILQDKLAKGDYSMSNSSTVSKRTFGDSMINEDSSTATNKRTSDNR